MIVSTKEIEIKTHKAANFETMAALWRDVEQRSVASFFQSWNWIGTLLANLPSDIPVELLTVEIGDETVGLALLIPVRHTRHHFIHTKELHLNATGRPEYDCLTIEYNGIIADKRFASAIIQAALSWLVEMRPDWDELHLAGVGTDISALYRKIGAESGLTVRIRDRKRADHVDLDAVRNSGKDYLENLSRNTRHQIRRSIRLYEDNGPVTLAAASSVKQALEFFDGLKELHQIYWRKRGKPGAFANPFFEVFHRDLINRCFDNGHIQIVQINVGERAIGYIYNFIAGLTVYQYQSGFCYDDDPKLKPGLVSHYLTIAHNLVHGASTYDFLAGESQHKKSLGNETTELDWLALQRDKLKFRVENKLRDLKHRLAVQGAA